MYKRVAQGPETDNVRGLRDLMPREAWALSPVIALTIFFGFYPQPLFDVINPAVDRVLEQVDAPPLAPEVPLEIGGEGP
jgi:NADH-quinone oxidoreductase subunit M